MPDGKVEGYEKTYERSDVAVEKTQTFHNTYIEIIEYMHRERGGAEVRGRTEDLYASVPRKLFHQLSEARPVYVKNASASSHASALQTDSAATCSVPRWASLPSSQTRQSIRRWAGPFYVMPSKMTAR